MFPELLSLNLIYSQKLSYLFITLVSDIFLLNCHLMQEIKAINKQKK